MARRSAWSRLALAAAWAALLVACGAKDALWLYREREDEGGAPAGGAGAKATGGAGRGGGGRGGAGAGGAAGGGMGGSSAGMAGMAGMQCQGGGVGRGPELIKIPGGSALLGSVDGDPDEQPRLLLTLRDFEMDETEVSVEQYDTCVAAGCCEPEKWDAVSCAKPSSADQPVACITAGQAARFCQWVGKRLPWEEEWEYAARGGDERVYPWGNEPPGTMFANYGGLDDGFARTAPVKSFAAGRSPFGLYGMAGNVWEWTLSPYCPYSGAICAAPPCNTCSDGTLVNRGGGWYSDAFSLRAANRNHSSASEASDRTGFRCAR